MIGLSFRLTVTTPPSWLIFTFEQARRNQRLQAFVSLLTVIALAFTEGKIIPDSFRSDAFVADNANLPDRGPDCA